MYEQAAQIGSTLMFMIGAVTQEWMENAFLVFSGMARVRVCMND
jgi:hypothetical protein